MYVLTLFHFPAPSFLPYPVGVAAGAANLPYPMFPSNQPGIPYPVFSNANAYPPPRY